MALPVPRPNCSVASENMIAPIERWLDWPISGGNTTAERTVPMTKGGSIRSFVSIAPFTGSPWRARIYCWRSIDHERQATNRADNSLYTVALGSDSVSLDGVTPMVMAYPSAQSLAATIWT